MATTGEHLRRVNRLASAILAVLILAVAAGILWMSNLGGGPEGTGQKLSVPTSAPPSRLEGQPEGPGSLSPLTPSFAEPATALPPRAVRTIPTPPSGKLEYVPPEEISSPASPAPRSNQAGEFDT